MAPTSFVMGVEGGEVGYLPMTKVLLGADNAAVVSGSHDVGRSASPPGHRTFGTAMSVESPSIEAVGDHDYLVRVAPDEDITTIRMRATPEWSPASAALTPTKSVSSKRRSRLNARVPTSLCQRPHRCCTMSGVAAVHLPNRQPAAESAVTDPPRRGNPCQVTDRRLGTTW